jgi:hypothetical protein
MWLYGSPYKNLEQSRVLNGVNSANHVKSFSIETFIERKLLSCRRLEGVTI